MTSAYKGLYYICRINNLESILNKGILARNRLDNIEHAEIHDPAVLGRRQEKFLPNGRELFDYVNLFLCPRNAMLYRLTCNLELKDLAILEIDPSVMETPECYYSNRNAATSDARFFPAEEFDKHIDREILKREYWTDSDDTKQKMMAEVLIAECISPDNIKCIYLPRSNDDVQTLAGRIPVSIDPHTFFRPSYRQKITDNIFLSRGDMFFSQMQTFTISVNLKGIMGKGLASRTKYQFPDAYVRYQDDCKSKKLKIGKPTLFKRAIRIEEDLADDKGLLEESKLNGKRWFLFLATKRHWREKSHFEDIEASMQWLVKNYKEQGIESIALPALGCGLGGLPWKDVGPMMCYYLNKMDIQSCIYLPMEQEQCKDEFLTAEYLMSYNER